MGKLLWCIATSAVQEPTISTSLSNLRNKDQPSLTILEDQAKFPFAPSTAVEMESETRRQGMEIIEKHSVINTTTATNPNVA